MGEIRIEFTIGLPSNVAADGEKEDPQQTEEEQDES